ncbi:MAG: hypothetical protein WCC57_13450 [Paracoccaceae bacterium]
MFTRLIASAVLLLMVGLAPVHADALEDSLVAQLKAQGYQSITVQYTLLGRLQLIATSENGVREIVVNPKTGEILRDYLRENSRIAVATAENRGADAKIANVVLPEIPTITPTTDSGDEGPTEIKE